MSEAEYSTLGPQYGEDFDPAGTGLEKLEEAASRLRGSPSVVPIEFKKSRKGWVGFDFDGTLSKYDGYGKPLGDPIPLMVEELRGHLLRGQECRIVTARATKQSDVFLIEKWCQEHVGMILAVTDKKDFDMWKLYDDRAVCVERNTGRILGEPVS